MSNTNHIADDVTLSPSPEGLPIVEVIHIGGPEYYEIIPCLLGSAVEAASDKELYRRTTSALFEQDFAWFSKNPGRNFRLRPNHVAEVFNMPPLPNIGIPSTMVIKLGFDIYIKAVINLHPCDLDKSYTDKGCKELLINYFNLEEIPSGWDVLRYCCRMKTIPVSGSVPSESYFQEDEELGESIDMVIQHQENNGNIH